MNNNGLFDKDSAFVFQYKKLDEIIYTRIYNLFSTIAFFNQIN